MAKCSGGETRTLNLAVNSRLLCRLSYPGIRLLRCSHGGGRESRLPRRCLPEGGNARAAGEGHNEQVKFRIGTAVAFLVGYTLGARAGRERYRQIVQFGQDLGRSTPVTGTVTLVGDKSKAVAALGVERVKDVIGVRLGWWTGTRRPTPSPSTWPMIWPALSTAAASDRSRRL